jgi:nitroimidazol reductase NimA-like FMN-containing flavoprotein (pyridoxamine 5'-phosphate oxidase superfamily)
MNFGERSEIKSFQKMVQFLETERIGRFATIDKNGFPFIAPMNYFSILVFMFMDFPRAKNTRILKPMLNAALK